MLSYCSNDHLHLNLGTQSILVFFIQMVFLNLGYLDDLLRLMDLVCCDCHFIPQMYGLDIQKRGRYYLVYQKPL
jgi:hypothetical protein